MGHREDHLTLRANKGLQFCCASALSPQQAVGQAELTRQMFPNKDFTAYVVLSQPRGRQSPRP